MRAKPKHIRCPLCGAYSFPETLVMSIAGRLAVAESPAVAERKTADDRVCRSCKLSVPLRPFFPSTAGRIANARRKEWGGPPKREWKCPWCPVVCSTSEMKEHMTTCEMRPPSGSPGRPKIPKKCRFCERMGGVVEIREHEREQHPGARAPRKSLVKKNG